MAFEIKYIFHPRKEDGSYDTTVKDEKLTKVGKSFEDTPLEKVAAVIMAQLARRDVWVVDVEVVELVRKPIPFKECKDGKGISLKNKRFSFNEAAQMVAEDIVEIEAQVPTQMQVQPSQHMQLLQPHEQAAAQSNLDMYYSNASRPMPVVRQNLPTEGINQNKVMYKVIFDPGPYREQVKQLKLRLTPDNTYSVHKIVPHHTQKLELQKLAITDDVGKVVIVEEKYFINAGAGLYADKEVGFTNDTKRNSRRPKLAFEDEMRSDAPDPRMAASQEYPLDDGSIPDHLLNVPDLRPSMK